MSITVTAIVSVTFTIGCHSLCQSVLLIVLLLSPSPSLFRSSSLFTALKTMHIFKSTFHHIKYNELVLNAFPKRNVLSCFLKEARLLQDLIGNGNEFQKLGAVLAKARFLSVG